jgi:hypothetical protein
VKVQQEKRTITSSNKWYVSAFFENVFLLNLINEVSGYVDKPITPVPGLLLQKNNDDLFYSIKTVLR